MTSDDEILRVVSATRDVAAGADRIFELIAEPTQQPRWDAKGSRQNKLGFIV